MHSSVKSQRSCGLDLDLARFRKRAGVTLEEIAERTKIGSRFLQAIENERFDELPGGIFSTSYLRQYAEAIGYDEQALVDFHNQKMAPRPPVPATKAEAETRGFLDRWFRTPVQVPPVRTR